MNEWIKRKSKKKINKKGGAKSKKKTKITTKYFNLLPPPKPTPHSAAVNTIHPSTPHQFATSSSTQPFRFP